MINRIIDYKGKKKEKMKSGDYNAIKYNKI